MRVKNLILILGVIVAYLGIIVYVRISNDRTIEKRYYQVWREDYIKNQSENEQYVNAAGKIRHRLPCLKHRDMECY